MNFQIYTVQVPYIGFFFVPYCAKNSHSTDTVTVLGPSGPFTAGLHSRPLVNQARLPFEGKIHGCIRTPEETRRRSR
jgi:hypothetical protein